MTSPTEISAADRQWAAAAYARMKTQHPDLTSYGFGLPRGTTDKWRDGLTDHDLDQITRARRWLEGMETVRHPRRIGSYSAKHSAESWAGGYIGEGSLILAALALAVPVKPYGWRGHGAYIGVAVRSVRQRRGLSLEGVTL
ncbi:hypothetical protein BBFGKLBO_03030 [Synechococcus sp. CBW1107]|uniref:hypothetical protein n=1 Tax=Synechococcus sp. CBW1107 TaxID=2789857 RepID=UPI002AD2EADD|nr:hypothetical protein [Synechococcus sp. CBW1107]CAK6701146.1 hypothetical protein BBFGKLBO_03030 [Synechococcus sp. CBW1107]